MEQQQQHQQPPTLPTDPLLEVIARSDDVVTTVVRCAAVSKPLRRAILDPGFRRRLGLRAAATGGFDPDLVTSVSYRVRLRADIDGTRFNHVIVHPAAAGSVRFDANLLRSYNPASSREALLVLRRDHERRGFVELLVCNAVTGQSTPLPRMDLHLASSGRTRADVYCPALLSTGGGGSSFELLVMYGHSRMDPQHWETQIFSSEAAGWGAARRIHLPQGVQIEEATFTAPAVIERTVHWLCNSRGQQPMAILALHAEAAQGTVIQLPQELLASLGGSHAMSRPENNLILAATAEGKRLSLVVAEKFVISVWTLLPVPDEGSSSSSSGWSREVVVKRREIGRELQLAAAVDAYQPIRFEVFGERSGTVLFWMQEIGLVQLNLGTKKVELLWKGSSRDSRGGKAFLHEVDLGSLLQRMKAF